MIKDGRRDRVAVRERDANDKKTTGRVVAQEKGDQTDLAQGCGNRCASPLSFSDDRIDILS